MIHPITEEIISLFKKNGSSMYGGEAVTQLEHALQCAVLAKSNNSSDELITASLLHDIGHLLHDLPDDSSDKGIDDYHEELAARYLEKNFTKAVVEPVKLHVQAKRYLCAVKNGYFETLSEPSKISLSFQGGVMTEEEVKEFEKNCPEISFDQVLLWGAGKEKLQAIKDTLTNTNHNLSEETIQEIFADFLQELEMAYQNLVVIPTKNTERLFLELRTMNIKVVLNTGYNFATATSLIHKLNWIEGVHYDLLVTASDVSKNRPHPDMILFAMQALDINDPNLVIKVGDSTIDIEEGKNAGCFLNIGVTTGAHTKEELQKANPDYIFDNIYDLKSIL